MTRTPPPLNLSEKSSAVIKVYCTPTEKMLWRAVFGGGRLGEATRQLLNRKARQLIRIRA